MNPTKDSTSRKSRTFSAFVIKFQQSCGAFSPSPSLKNGLLHYNLTVCLPFGHFVVISIGFNAERMKVGSLELLQHISVPNYPKDAQFVSSINIFCLRFGGLWRGYYPLAAFYEIMKAEILQIGKSHTDRQRFIQIKTIN